MNKILLIILVIVILIGGGYYYVRSQQKASEPAENTMMHEDTNTSSPAKEEHMESSSEAMKETGVKTFTVEGKNFSFTPNTITVNKGDKVEITFKSIGGVHDFMLDEFKVVTKQLSTGQSQTITFVADKTGTFEYYCSVGNHRAMGMVGKLTVK